MTTETAAIRNAVLAIATRVGLARGITNVRRTPMRTLDETDCPCITVLIGDDAGQADEDVTAGPPHFVHQAAFHVSVLRAFAPTDDLDDLVDADMDAMSTGILCDPGFNAMIEGIDSLRRQRAYPTGDAGTYFVELRFELVVQYRSLWQPLIPDDFLGADVRSLPVGADAQTEPNLITIDVETAP